MENFFVDELFFASLEDYLEWHELEINEISEYVDDYILKVELTTLEPMHTFKRSQILDLIGEERFPEDSESIENSITKAIEVSINFQALNELMPKLYYPNGNFHTFSKSDLLEALV